ncbi:MAG: hypothetical protein IPI90_19570 [Saprospiraceae bacterium]|nr:hypothetical protein [Candidatus Vicinibacter affinis]
MRTSTPNGCYLGAYGWVLNVRKDPPRTVVPNSQIPSLFTNDNEIHKLTFDAEMLVLYMRHPLHRLQLQLY